MKKLAPAFWVTNVSPRNVTLADLALNIKAFSTVNLLDSKHYKYTLEQLLKSKESGSLFAKRDKIKPRDLPPPAQEKSLLPFIQSSIIPDRGRSIYQIEDQEYEELKVSDEDQKKQDEIFAQENADLAEIDIQRSVINPPIKKV
jgi:hypothetical protein